MEKKIVLKIEMTCVTCANNVEKVLKEHVINMTINYILKIGKIKYDSDHITKEEIMKKIRGIGYECYEID